MSTETFAPGGYRFIPGMFQYSGGVAAEPGFRIERVRFRKPVPLAEGFRRIEAIISAAGRPMTSFCACELRSPEPFSEAGFIAFNQHYVGTLADWRVYDPATKVNPVARSNVCPELNKPAGPSFHAFSFTVASSDAAPSFVVSGSGEAPEGRGSYGKFVVRPGDTSAEGMREKARAVLGEMERRMGCSASRGQRRLRRRSTPCFPFTRSWPTKSSAAAPPSTASTGTSAVRPWSASTTKWTAATSASSA